MKILKNLLWLMAVVWTGLGAHKCIHDEVGRDHKLHRVKDGHLQRRFLQSSYGYGPMRIHREYNTTQIRGTDMTGKNLMKIMDIISEFWALTIQIDYSAGLGYQVTGISPDLVKCLSFSVPRTIVENTIPNKDFGLLIEAVDDGDSGVTAYSYPCASSESTKRPLWGFIHWNKNYLSFNPLNFQENLHIGIHEVFHILGFSQILYQDFSNKALFQVNAKGTFLDGPFIRQAVREQYACEDPPGMPLETGGGSGTAFSHWAKKTAANELMTAGVSVNNPTISYVSLALLEETGWYRRVYKDLGKLLNFGLGKGCEMLDYKNCSSDEYCEKKDEKMVDYDHTALGYCKNDSLSICLYVKFYVNFICTDPNYAQKSLHADQGKVNVTGETGGFRSRCYHSDLHLPAATPTKYSFRCYETLCSPNYRTLTIRVGDQFGLCHFPNQKITIQGYVGTLQCPASFQAACAVARCPDECNANGICLNGRCLCSPNYEGSLCEKLSSTGFSSRTTLFLSSQNNNCLIGTYRNLFGDCEACAQGCAKCDSTECLLCLDESLPSFGSCTL